MLYCVLRKLEYLQKQCYFPWEKFVPNSGLRKFWHGTPTVGECGVNKRRPSSVIYNTWCWWQIEPGAINHGPNDQPSVDHTVSSSVYSVMVIGWCFFHAVLEIVTNVSWPGLCVLIDSFLLLPLKVTCRSLTLSQVCSLASSELYWPWARWNRFLHISELRLAVHRQLLLLNDQLVTWKGALLLSAVTWVCHIKNRRLSHLFIV